MITTGSYHVHADWLQDGSLLLWGSRGNRPVDPAELKDHLFAWHEPSFYGTFVEMASLGLKKGVKLAPGEALDYFSQTPELLHTGLSWDEDAQELRDLAPAVGEALSRGRFMPDYEQWKRGQLGWKLDLGTNEAARPTGDTARRWIEALAAERAAADPALRAALERLARELPEGEADADLWLDEEDWLTAIGWVTDPSPYRTCLQLIEPEGGRAWHLQPALQDRTRPEELVPVQQGGEPAPGASLPPEWADANSRVPREVQRWMHLLPWLREENTPDRLKTELSDDEAWELLAHGAVRLAEAGSAVLLPAWWDRIRRQKPKLRAKVKSSVGAAAQSLFGLDQILEFDWRLAIGGMELTEAEFNELLERKSRLVRFRGEWVQIDPAQLEEIRRAMKRARRRKGLTFREVLEMHLLGDVPIGDAGEDQPETDRLRMEVELNDHLQQVMKQLDHGAHIPIRETPEDFHGSLRRYQAEGLSWLLFLRRLGLGGCLADDMGLGKTIQWITYLLAVKEERESQDADSQHAVDAFKSTPEAGITARDMAEPDPFRGPSLLICPTSVLGNWQKELERFAPSLNVHLHYGTGRLRDGAFADKVKEMDLVLTSYNLAHLDEEVLNQVYWNSICLDEAQNIKNVHTKQASAVRRLKGYHRIALTGTPIENRLTELWSIFDFLNPGYLGPLREFTRRYVVPIERTGDREATGKVQRLIRPFLLRRVKNDPNIRLDLPDKTESNLYVSLTAEQATLYENHIRDMFDRLEQLSPMERRGLILSALTRLKQLCDHPSLLLKEGRANWRGRSNKIERLLDMVRELRAEGDRCLIFTQFVEAGHLLQTALQEELGETALFLHGGIQKTARDTMIARFQDDSLPDEERPGIFLLSLRAGGTGLNLTAASHVFHFDRWWNPAVENQATDRAYRIGQTKHVQVHKFVTLGTLEERIDEMIGRKLGLSSQIVGTGENWITEMSTDELRELFQLRREWIDA